MSQAWRGKSGILVIRIWTESGPHDWRARITQSLNGGARRQTVSYATSAAEVHASVREWLTSFTHSGDPGGD